MVSTSSSSSFSSFIFSLFLLLFPIHCRGFYGNEHDFSWNPYKMKALSASGWNTKHAVLILRSRANRPVALALNSADRGLNKLSDIAELGVGWRVTRRAAVCLKATASDSEGSVLGCLKSQEQKNSFSLICSRDYLTPFFACRYHQRVWSHLTYS